MTECKTSDRVPLLARKQSENPMSRLGRSPTIRRVWLIASAWLALIVAAPATAAEDGPRRLEGRIEPSIRKKLSFKSAEERKARIAKILKQEAELLAKLNPPLLFCRRVKDGAIKVDGKLDDAAWKQADVANNFKGTRNLQPSKLHTKAMLLWDSKHLYVGFHCDDSDVIATIDKPDGDYWREDTAEVFLDPDGDGMTYLEFEASPRGHLYDGAIADYRPEIDWPADLEHLDIEGSSARYRVRDSKLAVHVDGTLNNPKDEDRGWTCEYAISFADIARGTDMRGARPEAGDRWRVGLFHINNRQHGDEKLAEYDAWSPTTSWFHVPKLFGHVVFLDK